MGNVRIFVCVTNDLATDQRVHKMCMFLHDQGAAVTLIGRKLPSSMPLDRQYRIRRLTLLFKTGPLFYGFFNLRLFFRLLFSRCDIIVSNDLDTLWACAWAKRFKRKAVLVYDSHEIFTEVPELSHSPSKKKIWQRIERKNIGKADHCITVNQSIAQWFYKQYEISFEVVRNMPMRLTNIQNAIRPTELNEKYKYLIVQGAGINVDRGNEELLESLPQLPPEIHLLIIGSGDVLPLLKKRTVELNLTQRVHFFEKMNFEKLMQYTQHAWMGITLDKNTNLNYLYSLPNKLFDFIQAKCPVLASDLPEVSQIVTNYKVGVITPSPAPDDIAKTIMQVYQSPDNYAELKKNTVRAAEELCWENERPVLEKIYGPYLRAQR